MPRDADAAGRPALDRALRVLRPVWSVVAVGVVAAMVVVAVRDAPLDAVDWWLLAPAAAASLVWWLGLARIWAIVVSGGASAGDVRTWCRTQTLRYLPGGFWAPVSRIAVVQGRAADRVLTVAAENVVALCAALAIGGACLALDGRIGWAPLMLALAVPPAAALLARQSSRVDLARTVRATGTALVAFLAFAGAAVLVQAAVSGDVAPLAVAGAATVAWGVGLVAVFAPGGVGVRELVYVALVAGTLPDAEAAAAAVTFRLVTIVAELVVLLAVSVRTPATAQY